MLISIHDSVHYFTVYVSGETFKRTTGSQSTTTILSLTVLVYVPDAVATSPRDGDMMPRAVGDADVGHFTLTGHVDDEAVTVGDGELVVLRVGGV